MKNNKIKLSVGLMLGIATLFGFFVDATPASALTCNSATITGTVYTGTPPTQAWFEYGTDYNTLATYGGTQTAVLYFPTEGSFPVEQFISGLSESTTYYYQLLIVNNYGTEITSIRNFTTPACQQTQNPTVNLTANPSTINSGQNSTLSWNSQNANSCSSNWGPRTVSLNGNDTVSPTTTTNYTVTCYGANGTTVSDSATVYVNQNNNDVSVDISADDTNIDYADSTRVRWDSDNADYCTASGGSNGWAGDRNTSGSFNTGSLTSDKTYRITCYNDSDSATDSVTVNVNDNNNENITVNLTANPSTIQSGQGSTLNWSSNDASYCSSSWNGNSATSGSRTVYPTYTTNYNITCYGNNGQSASDSVTVYVNQVNTVCQDPNAINYRGALPCRYQQINNQPTVGIAADQISLPFNGATFIRWFTTNAASCNASGGSVGWAGAKSIGPASFYTGSLTGSRTFTLTCSNSFGSASDSVTVNVRGQVINNPPAPTSLVLINSSIDRNQPIVPTIDNTRPRPGDEINYTVNYQNIGTASITGLALRMNLPYEVDYMFSTPSNPIVSGNTLVFNLGTLRANGQGTVTVRVRVRENIPAGTNLNFPATLSYIDPSGQVQSVNANVSAQVWSAPETVDEKVSLGANVFWAGFLPTNLFGWLLLIILILVLVLLARYLFGPNQSFSKKTTTTTVK